jgi:hypothetical protein
MISFTIWTYNAAEQMFALKDEGSKDQTFQAGGRDVNNDILPEHFAKVYYPLVLVRDRCIINAIS